MVTLSKIEFILIIFTYRLNIADATSKLENEVMQTSNLTFYSNIIAFPQFNLQRIVTLNERIPPPYGKVVFLLPSDESELKVLTSVNIKNVFINNKLR